MLIQIDTNHHLLQQLKAANVVSESAKTKGFTGFHH